MIEKIENSWRPFIKLTAANYHWNEDDTYTVYDTGYVFMYANEKPTFVRDEEKGITKIHLETADILVKETPEEIVAVLSAMADDARKKEAEEQERYLAERVKQMEALKAGE